jgi:hypothetical protein
MTSNGFLFRHCRVKPGGDELEAPPRYRGAEVGGAELLNNDGGRRRAFALHQGEQDRGVAWIEPHAAV